MATELFGPWPVWVWGEARVDGEEIVLAPDKARPYDAPNSEHHSALLCDLAALRDFKLQDPVEFVRRHGLIWHGPDQMQREECRESLQWWRTWGVYTATTIGLYAALQEGLDANTAEAVKAVKEYMRSHRDVGWGYGIIPDAWDDVLRHASILLSERITKGLQSCKQTLVAACGVSKGGKAIGPAGDFYYRTQPTDLIGAAHLQLAGLVANKAEARKCKGCGRWFVPKHGRQWHHTPECGRNRRRRKSYSNTKDATASGSNAAAMRQQ
jgi:hypothetical protein